MTTLFFVLTLIFLFILILLISKIHILLDFKNEFSLKIRIWFFSYKFFPYEKKIVDKKSNKTEKKSKNNKEAIVEKKTGLHGFIDTMKVILNLVSITRKKLLNYLIVEKFNLNIKVASEDAANTALEYGYACSIIYPAVNILMSYPRKSNYSINISPDFNEDKSLIVLSAKIGLKVWQIIYILFWVIINYKKYEKVVHENE